MQRCIRLAQANELAHQLVLELAPQMAAVHLDAGPRVAARQQPVRVAHVLVFDREGVRRITPLPLREDERRGLTRAGPVAHRPTPPPPPPPLPPPQPPPQPPPEPLQPLRPLPMPPSQKGSRKMRPRLNTINNTTARISHLIGSSGAPPSPASGGGAPERVMPNSCANACATGSTPRARAA